MLVTNQTNQDYWFGPLHLPAGIGQQITVDDTTSTSLYLTDDAVADALNNLYLAGKITVSSQAQPFPRPTGTPQVLHGDGSPEGLIFAPQGSLYLRRDTTGTANALYSKTTGITVDTGWVVISSSPVAALTQLFDLTLSGSQASIDIQNIPATYSHLQIEFLLRSDNASGSDLHWTINNDSAAHYLYHSPGLTQNSVSPYTALNGQYGINTAYGALALGVSPSGETANVFSAGRIIIPAYTNGGTFKSWYADAFYGNSNTTTGWGTTYSGGYWQSTAALSRLTFSPSAGNFVQYSRITLYGLT